jgi:hypothetical protein
MRSQVLKFLRTLSEPRLQRSLGREFGNIQRALKSILEHQSDLQQSDLEPREHEPTL